MHVRAARLRPSRTRGSALVGHSNVFVVEAPLAEARRLPEVDPELLRHGSASVLLAIADAVVDDDEPVIRGCEANLTRVSVRQKEDMHKISAWVAMAAVPTMIAGVHGMNVEHMPELDEVWTCPAVVTFMVVCRVMYRRSRRAGWLCRR